MSSAQSHESGLSPAFDHHFSALLELATWNEATGGDNAWFMLADHPLHIQSRLATKTWKLTEAIQGEHAATYVPAPGIPQPDWLQTGLEARTLRYAVTELLDEPPTTTGRVTAVRGFGGNIRTTNIPELQNPHIRPATIGRVCVRGCTVAQTHTELAFLTNTYANWATAYKVTDTPDGDHVGRHSMSRSLLIAHTQNTYSTAAPYAEALASLDLSNPHHKALRRAAVDILGNSLLYEDPMPFGSRNEKTGIPETANDAVSMLDEYGVLDGTWWVIRGISAGGIFTIPGFLEKVHDKLNNKQATETLKQFSPEDARSYVNTHVSKLLHTYAASEGRTQDVLKKVLKATADGRGMVDLSKLIGISNGIIRGKNQRLRPGETPLETLDPRNMRDVGDALLHILELTRSQDPALQQSQQEQDILHVEIIDMLHMALRDARSQLVTGRLSSVQLRYPAANDEELRDIMGELKNGKPIMEVRTRYRRAHNISPLVDVQRLKKPGSGYMS
ncbi:MAG TPA: hypothetical protein VLE73_02020 [Candidatus Saccharimonadales bacterium]|nr:hypothetical protein [Candidatus Saccharimonadales bacterium]